MASRFPVLADASAAPGTPRSGTPEPQVRVNNVERERYLRQIKAISHDLADAQGELSVLLTSNRKLASNLEKNERAKEDQQAMGDDLRNHTLALITRQQIKIEKMISDKSHAVGKLEMELKQVEDAKAQQTDKYEALVMSLQANIAKKEQDAITQAQTEKTLLDAKRELSRQKSEYRQKIRMQELRSKQAHHKLDLKFHSQVNQLTEKMKSLSDSLMAETTKRTIEENIRLNKTIEGKSAENQRLVHKNEAASVEVAHIKRQMEMLKHSEDVLATRLTRAKKRIKEQMGRVKELERMGVRAMDSDRKIAAEIERLEGLVVSKEDDLKQLESALATKEDALDAARNDKYDAMDQQREVLSSLDGTAAFIVSCLEEAKKAKASPSKRRMAPEIKAVFVATLVDALKMKNHAGENEAPALQISTASPLSIPLKKNKAVQTASMQRALMYERELEPSRAPVRDQDASTAHVVSDVRPWGKESTDLPLTVKSQKRWLKKKGGPVSKRAP